MKLYLSGPMTGLPDHNREAFNKREGMLKRRGYDVVNPARTDLGPTANLGTNGGSQCPQKRRAGGHSPNLADVVEKS